MSLLFHSTLIDDRQHDMRRVLSRMQHGLLGRLHPGAGHHIFPGVQIAAEAREVAAADIEPQAVPGQKRMARRTEFDLEFVDLARLQKFRLSQAFAIAPHQVIVFTTGWTRASEARWPGVPVGPSRLSLPGRAQAGSNPIGSPRYS